MRLYVDGKSCPTGDIDRVPIGFSLEDMLNPQAACSGRKMEMTIPSTAESNEIFGVARDIYAAERFNDSHHTARLECDGVTLFEGTIYLLDASVGSRSGGDYKVRIVEGGKDWAKDAARRELRSSGIWFNMALTPENICSTWEGEQSVRFLPVLRNRYTAEYSGVSLGPKEQVLTTDDYHPFFSVPALFERIFRGYEVESSFLQSDEFRQLLFSGQYGSPDTAKQQKLLDFKARRAAPVTAVANEYGKVYATAAFDDDESLGNIVDTADPTAVDSDGKLMQDTFTTGNVFGVDEEGYIRFESAIAANVGFLLHLEYQTDYCIESRTRLRGFDTVISEPIVEAHFPLSNGFKDKQNELVAGLTYNLCIFDYVPSSLYMFKIFDRETGEELESRVIDGRFTQITMPEECSPVCTLEPMLGESLEHSADWALYPGHVQERGVTEVVVDIRIPPQEFLAGDKMRFNRIRFQGAEPGMAITLSPECSLRPYFTNVPGLGSVMGLTDIAHNKMWLIELVEAVCQMFNLVIYTDERAKRVIIEPEEAFYGDRVWEWSHKIDYSEPLRISDLGVDAPQWVEHRYKEGDYASAQYNEQYGTDIGCWRSGNQVYGALDTTKVVESPLFTTGVNKCGVYAFAPSASLLQVGDSAAEGAIDMPFTTHIVRYLGLRPLPEGEVWGPLGEARYPLAAFFFEGDGQTEGFSLCFEPRDGIAGLSRYFEQHAERVTRRQRLTATLRLSPAEIESLLSAESEGATIRDTFRLKLFNETSLYRLESIRGYNPATQSAECTFIRLMKD